MTIAEELEHFHQFAADRLQNGGADCSLEELLHQWRAQQEREEASAGIRRGLADAQAGRTQPWNEFIDEFRAARGISPDA